MYEIFYHIGYILNNQFGKFYFAFSPNMLKAILETRRNNQP